MESGKLKNLFVEERIINIMEQQQQANERNIRSWPWKEDVQKEIQIAERRVK